MRLQEKQCEYFRFYSTRSNERGSNEQRLLIVFALDLLFLCA